MKTRIKIKKNPNHLFILVSMLLFVNPLSNLMVNIFGIGNVYYVSYVCWIVFFFYIMICDAKRSLFQFLLVMIMLLSFVLGSIWGDIYLNNGFLENLHIVIITCFAYSCSIYSGKKLKLYSIHMDFLMKLITTIGTIACFYAMIAQRDKFLLLLQDMGDLYNSWGYTSFFGNRNVFAGYLYIASIAACYMFMRRQNKIYLVIVAFLGMNIFMTNSRAALIAYALCISICFFLKRSNKLATVILIIVVATCMFLTTNAGNSLIEKFTHVTNGVDSGITRVMMWKSGITYLMQNGALLFGYGMGASPIYFMPLFNVGSSHNAYMDVLFNGGLVYLSIILFTILKSFKNIRKYKWDEPYYISLMGGFLAYCIYSMFEAGMSLFAGTYFSVTVTIFFIIIPTLYRGSEEYLQGDMVYAD